MEELVQQFSLERVGKHGSKFDPEKARWFNHQYMIRKTDEELAGMLMPILEANNTKADPGYVIRVIQLIRDRIVLIPDLWKNSWFFFLPPAEFDPEVRNRIWKPETGSIVNGFLEEAELIEPWNSHSVHSFIQDFTAKKGIKTGQVMNALRLLVVGSNQGPGMTDIAGLLGKKEFLGRIREGLRRIG
jgi:glutamyl-tRNA synthetase